MSEFPGGEPKPVHKEVVSNRLRMVHLLGQRFGDLVEDAEAVRDFTLDNALFRMRQENLAERIAERDSPAFRKEVQEDVEELTVLYQRSHTETNPKLLQAFEALAEKAKKGVGYDSAWERLLTDTERRVKVITTVMQTLQREEVLFSVTDLTKKLDQVISIIYSEVGDEPTERIVARIEREVLGVYRGVGSRTEAEAVAALGSGE